MKPAVALFLLLAVAAVRTDDIDDKKVEDKDKDKPVDVDHHKPERPVIQLPSIPSFPIFPQIHFPQIHFPPIPIPQLPQLPSLPSLPKLPRPFKKETVVATKTVFVETVKKVTKHAVCVTALPGKQRPCLYGGYNRDDLLDNEEATDGEKIQPTAVAAVIPSTAVADDTPRSESDSGERLSDSLAPSVEDEADAQLTSGLRQGRYLVPHPIRKFHPHVAFEATEPLSVDTSLGLRVDALEEGDNHFKPGLLKATHYVTKTLYVTKIEEVLDHKVTATLLAKNCIPSEALIPRCRKWKDDAPESEKTDESPDAS